MGMIGVFACLLPAIEPLARVYGTPVEEGFSAMIRTPDSGLVLVGSLWETGGYRDFLVVKLESSGQVEWARRVAGLDPYAVPDAVLAPDNTLVLMACTPEETNQFRQVLALKVSLSGSLIWRRSYYTPSSTFGTSLCVTPDTGCLIAGKTGKGYSTRPAVWKINSYGEKRWCAALDSMFMGEATCVTVTNEGNYLAGLSCQISAAHDIGLLVALDTAGNYLWTKSLGEGVYPRKIIRTSDRGYAICGRYDYFYDAYHELFVAKLDSGFNPVWSITLDDTTGDEALAITETPDSGFLVSGYTENTGSGGRDCLVLKLDPGGNLDWARTFGSSSDEELAAGIPLGTGFAMAGGTESFGAGNQDALLLVLGLDGEFHGCAVEFYTTLMPGPVQVADTFLSKPAIYSNYEGGSATLVEASLEASDACLQVEEGPGQSLHGLLCYPVAGGLGFVAPAETEVKLYLVDGRLARRAHLNPGDNRLTLRPGVWFWMAGQYKGKAVVR